MMASTYHRNFVGLQQSRAFAAAGAADTTALYEKMNMIFGDMN